jgi:hypothetical protein
LYDPRTNAPYVEPVAHDPLLNGLPTRNDKAANVAIMLGVAGLLLLVAALLVTLIVTLSTHDVDAPHRLHLVQAEQSNMAAQDDATYGLDQDKRTIEQAANIGRQHP